MKIISLGEKQKEALLIDFASYINNLKTNATSIDYKIKIEKSLGKNIQKPLVYFTKVATDKMKALVNGTDKEIAWHGIIDKQKHTYIVEDILVYPQVVTSVTVNTDDEEYAKWLNAIDDVSFNKLRMQGHSHVNMGVSPSAVDTTYYNLLLNNLNKDDYYMFLILNKKNSIFINIYDYTQNIIFETEDIMVQFEETESYRKWYEDAMTLIKETPKIKEIKTNTRTNSYWDRVKKDDDEWLTNWRQKNGYQ